MRTEDGLAGSTVVRLPVTFERGALDLVVGIAGEWVVGVNLLPPADGAAVPVEWSAPEYIDSSPFDEQDVTIEAMGLAVPGTLSVPRNRDRVPAVLLLAGSGPQDRDETIGVNKRFKDLAGALPAPQELFRPEILALISHPTGRYAAALRDNDVCHWAPSVPTRFYAAHGDRDVVFASAEQCRQQVMAQGGTAEVIDMGNVDHVGTAIASVPLIRTWFSQLASKTT